MNNCESCGHKETAIKNNWCFIKSSRPAGNTCMMWTQGKTDTPLDDMDLPEGFGDIFNDFFGDQK